MAVLDISHLLGTNVLKNPCLRAVIVFHFTYVSDNILYSSHLYSVYVALAIQSTSNYQTYDARSILLCSYRHDFNASIQYVLFKINFLHQQV